TRDELVRVARHLKSKPSRSTDEDELLKLPLLAYPDRVCRRRGADPAGGGVCGARRRRAAAPPAGAMVGGAGVRLAPESVVRQSEFFLALDARSDERSARREALVRVASAIEVQRLAEIVPPEL